MTQKWATEDELSYSFMNFCGFVSGLFFADALRRINKAFNMANGLKKN